MQQTFRYANKVREQGGRCKVEPFLAYVIPFDALQRADDLRGDW